MASHKKFNARTAWKIIYQLIDIRESIEHNTYIHKIRLEDKKFNFEDEKMATPTTRLATDSICGRLPFDVSDDTTEIKEKQGDKINRTEFDKKYRKENY